MRICTGNGASGQTWNSGIQPVLLRKITHKWSHYYVEPGRILRWQGANMLQIKGHSRWKANRRNILRPRKDGGEILDVGGGKVVLLNIILQMHWNVPDSKWNVSLLDNFMISCTKKIILRWTSGTVKFVNVRCTLSPLPTIGWGQESHPLGHLTENVPRAGCAMQ